MDSSSQTGTGCNSLWHSCLECSTQDCKSNWPCSWSWLGKLSWLGKMWKNQSSTKSQLGSWYRVCCLCPGAPCCRSRQRQMWTAQRLSQLDQCSWCRLCCPLGSRHSWGILCMHLKSHKSQHCTCSPLCSRTSQGQSCCLDMLEVSHPSSSHWEDTMCS